MYSNLVYAIIKYNSDISSNLFCFSNCLGPQVLHDCYIFCKPFKHGQLGYRHGIIIYMQYSYNKGQDIGIT